MNNSDSITQWQSHYTNCKKKINCLFLSVKEDSPLYSASEIVQWVDIGTGSFSDNRRTGKECCFLSQFCVPSIRAEQSLSSRWTDDVTCRAAIWFDPHPQKRHFLKDETFSKIIGTNQTN